MTVTNANHRVCGNCADGMPWSGMPCPFCPCDACAKLRDVKAFSVTQLDSWEADLAAQTPAFILSGDS